MNEDVFNTAIRKFLKEVGVTSQREIEKTVRDAVASGKLKGSETAGEDDADARPNRAHACGGRRDQAGVTFLTARIGRPPPAVIEFIQLFELAALAGGVLLGAPSAGLYSTK